MQPSEPLFSILIPTWNNLPFLQLCLKSIEKNSTFCHQILIFVNEGIDGTLEWVRNSGYEYAYSEQNAGVCWALNALRPLVKNDYILYLNDDMYVCPLWDKYLWDEIQSMPDNKFFISSTMIQPRPFFAKEVIAPADYGTTIETFDEERLLAEYDKLPHHDWLGATWPPNIVHRDLWDLVGGYSIEFSPGMYSDPDFSAKLWLSGVRCFKGVSKSRVYHFEQTSTGRINANSKAVKARKNNGSTQFLMKYGMTSATFKKYILHAGEPFKDEKDIVTDECSLRLNLLRGKLKQVLYVTRNFMVSKLWER